jgi:hypothetical protein
VSRGAEVWHAFGLLVQKGELCLMDDATLVSQLSTRKTTFDSRGRMGLEPKEKMAERGLASPDRADAVAGVYGVSVGNWALYTKRPAEPWEDLDKDLGAGVRAGLSPSREQAVLKEIGGWGGF